eukprot:15337918-Ditylum_brightwellii.AAC.1
MPLILRHAARWKVHPIAGAAFLPTLFIRVAQIVAVAAAVILYTPHGLIVWLIGQIVAQLWKKVWGIFAPRTWVWIGCPMPAVALFAMEE